jgi:hypothetical protein
MEDQGSTGGGTSVTLVVPPSAVTPSPTSTPGVIANHPRPHLPFSGFDLGTALVLATLLLAVGVLLLLKGRRPNPHNRRT